LKKTAIILGCIILLGACKSGNNELNVPGWEMETGEIELPVEATEDIIENISSPIEMAALIRDLGLEFDRNNISDLDNVDSYATSFQMAYNLGMLAADLGYLNVYEKTATSVSYLSSINRLADGLKISQFFDFNTMKRLATSNSSLDSLIFMSVHSFNQMDEHLRSTDRSNLSALMMSGVWIEGMFQVTQVISKKNNEELAEYVGEQKLVLNNLLVILDNYSRDEQFARLIEDYQSLKKVFEEVEISYKEGELIEKEVDGMLVVEQVSESKVNISEETITRLVETTRMIRNKHLTM